MKNPAAVVVEREPIDVGKPKFFAQSDPTAVAGFQCVGALHITRALVEGPTGGTEPRVERWVEPVRSGSVSRTLIATLHYVTLPASARFPGAVTFR